MALGEPTEAGAGDQGGALEDEEQQLGLRFGTAAVLTSSLAWPQRCRDHFDEVVVGGPATTGRSPHPFRNGRQGGARFLPDSLTGRRRVGLRR
jgi:hypothetical protein